MCTVAARAELRFSSSERVVREVLEAWREEVRLAGLEEGVEELKREENRGIFCEEMGEEEVEAVGGGWSGMSFGA